MTFSKESIEAVFMEKIDESELIPEDIPNLDLYMDQIITLFSEKMPSSEQDKPLTKTMINNYSKAGVLHPIKGKKYSKKHVLQILIVCMLKQTLSINEIKRLLDHLVVPEEKAEEEEIIDRYHRYLAIKEEKKEALSGFLKDIIEDTTEENSLLPLVLELSWISNCTREMCKTLVQAYTEEPKKK